MRLFVGVVLSPYKMQGDIRFITDHPAVVTGRSGRNVEERTSAEFVNGTVLHRSRGAAGEYQSNMLYVAARSADAWPDVNGPFPSGLVGGAADGHAADADEFEFSFFEGSYLVGFFKTFQNGLKHRIRLQPRG